MKISLETTIAQVLAIQVTGGLVLLQITLVMITQRYMTETHLAALAIVVLMITLEIIIVTRKHFPKLLGAA